mmetsp:Transcript_38937/g.83086  ORF Transcript_38937/g.83086 Transcript_38937/m.83086 type:complete len:356 (-) Transcript_38937:254-1321(-)
MTGWFLPTAAAAIRCCCSASSAAESDNDGADIDCGGCCAWDIAYAAAGAIAGDSGASALGSAAPRSSFFLVSSWMGTSFSEESAAAASSVSSSGGSGLPSYAAVVLVAASCCFKFKSISATDDGSSCFSFWVSTFTSASECLSEWPRKASCADAAREVVADAAAVGGAAAASPGCDSPRPCPPSATSPPPPPLSLSTSEAIAASETPSARSIRRSIASRAPAFLEDMFKTSDSSWTRSMPRDDGLRVPPEPSSLSFEIRSTSSSAIPWTLLVRSAGLENVDRNVDASSQTAEKLPGVPSLASGSCFDSSRAMYHSSHGMASRSISRRNQSRALIPPPAKWTKSEGSFTPSGSVAT